MQQCQKIYVYIWIHTISKALSITIAGINFLGTNACSKNTQYAGQHLSVKAMSFNLPKIRVNSVLLSPLNSGNQIASN